jgi:hypothetical protein
MRSNLRLRSDSQLIRATNRIDEMTKMLISQSPLQQLAGVSRCLGFVELGGGLYQAVGGLGDADVQALVTDMRGVAVHGVSARLVGGNAGRTSGGWVCVFDAAVAGLVDLLVRPEESGTAGHVAQQQDQEPDAEEGVGHGGSGGGAGLRALGLGIALDDQLTQLEGCVGGGGNLARLPAREPGLRDACATVDLALRQVVLLPEAHQKAAGFALLGAHKAQSYAMSPSVAMPNRIIFFCIVRV